MLSVGRILREQRERQRLTLSAVSNRTKISQTVLEAIERDDITQIPSAFLYKSFVRQIASVLDIDFGSISEPVDAIIERFPALLVPGQRHRPTGLRPIGPQRERPSSWFSAIFSLLAVVIVCSGLYAYLDRIEPPGAVSITHNRQTQLQLAMPEPILLRIAAVDTAWLSMDSDGHHIFSGLLKPADTKELQGRDSARLLTGNAGGLTVTFNGRELGRLGQSGQVRTVLFTRSEYEILQPALSSRLQLIPTAALSGWSR
jgi:cytoskeleton protein RodZ